MSEAEQEVAGEEVSAQSLEVNMRVNVLEAALESLQVQARA